MKTNFKTYFPDMVFGGVDGLVTTFAIVTGVMGAGLSSGVILVLGFANLFADGFSMAASNYLSTKSENDMKQNTKSAHLSALSTFVAFVLIGFIPLTPFIFNFGYSNFFYTIILTCVAFAILGYIRGVVTGSKKICASGQTLLIGISAAGIAFVIGYLISNLAGTMI